jgi:predicted O-linked N-acetylglucosamine transferase (SPINDLY family)
MKRAITLFNLRRMDEALEGFEATLRARPDWPDALNNRANTLVMLGRAKEALDSIDAALRSRPAWPGALMNRGIALLTLRRLDEALECFDAAVQARPDWADALMNRALALLQKKTYQQAAEAFGQLLALQPDYPAALQNRLISQLNCADWREYAEVLPKILTGIETSDCVGTPFPMLMVTDSPRVQRQAALGYVRWRHLASSAPMWQGRRDRAGRIKLAYLSPDFGEHPVAYLMVGLLERHDRSRFEVFCLSFQPHQTSPTARRLQAGVEHFIDVSERSDKEVTAWLRAQEIDIAIDLTGYTAGCRPAILAPRPVPVQVQYLGYPATMGAPWIDYLIADDFVIPPALCGEYTEADAALPECFQANDDRRHLPTTAPPRAELELPESGVVLCGMNQTGKISPAVFDIWMGLLRLVPGSVLWLLGAGGDTETNLRSAAEARGVAPDRLRFAGRLPYPQHLARLGAADLFLDTLPFNAGATASDALWAGLPVLTCTGDALAARMAGSLLHAVGLPELVTQSLTEYEALALRLMTEPGLLAGLRARLGHQRHTAPLFNTDRFRRHFEAALETMWHQHQRGEAPAASACRHTMMGWSNTPTRRRARASPVQTEVFERIKMLDKHKVRACAVSHGKRNRL